MGRRTLYKYSVTVSTKFEESEYKRVQEIAELESLHTGKIISAQELIRNAVRFVYGDNERLRECFRRSRYWKVKKCLKGK